GPDAAVWNQLAEQSRNIFLTRDFAEAWWSTYRPWGKPVVLTDRPQQPRCILPLYRSHGPVPFLRQIGHGPADALGPLCASGDEARAADMVRSQLGRELRQGILVLHDVAADEAWDARLGGSVVRSTPGPAIRRTSPSWQEFLATRTKNFRSHVRRNSRRLHDAFDVTIRVSTADTLEEDVSTLLGLHRLRWGEGAPFATGRGAELVRSFARRCQERGWLRLSVLELDGHPAAADLVLRFAGVYSSWQGGWDPQYREQYSVGSVLEMESLRSAVEDGASEYRLLRGDEAYKQRLANTDQGTCTVTITRGRMGTAMTTAA